MFYIIPSMLQPFHDLFSRLRLTLAPPDSSFPLEPALHAALLQLAEKEHRTPQELHADLLASALARRQIHTDLVQRWQSLSPREQEVAALACRNYTNRQVAARLGVSPETVKTHVRNTLVKFNLHGKSELRMAIGDWDFSDWA
jgi:DNA-binding CsgD family transcriptional regulator